jgi:hypothetical protein
MPAIPGAAGADAPPAPPGPPGETIEQKYNFPLSLKGRLKDWLDFACVPDPEHPAGTIHSIYYDTPDLRHYAEKVNSDFQKSKVRLRWYGDLPSMPDAAEVTCFLEVKNKFGAIRRKGRTVVKLPARVLKGEAYSHPHVLALADEALGHNYRRQGLLVPMADIKYNRLRYVEPRTGARVSLDTEIHCPRVNADFLPAFTRPPLDKGVFEIKSPHRHLLAAFGPVSAHLSKAAFSKYYECLGWLFEPFGRRI